MEESAKILAAIIEQKEMLVRELIKLPYSHVRPLFEEALIERIETRYGPAVIPTAAAWFDRTPQKPQDEQKDYPDVGFTFEQMAYLSRAYPAGAPFQTMMYELHCNATKLLKTANQMKLDRPRLTIPKKKTVRQKEKYLERYFGSEVPAWKFRRLRLLILECRERGSNTRDLGEDLIHRSLQRAFQRGRLDMRPMRGTHAHFTPHEEARLMDLHEHGLTPGEIGKEMDRRADGIGEALRLRGIFPNNRQWTEDEDERLVAGIARGLTAREIANTLMGRSHLACKQRAKVMWPGRGNKLWNEADSHALVQVYEEGSRISDLAKQVGRTVSACRWRARYLGLEHPASTMKLQWTPAEDDIIRKGYTDGKSVSDIEAELPGRWIRGIYQRAFKLGLAHKYSRPWTAQDLEDLRDLVTTGVRVEKIAENAGRSKHAIYRRAKRHGFIWPARHHKRKDASGKYVRRDAGHYPDDERSDRDGGPAKSSVDKHQAGMV
ncbi:MAG: hypothetical protein HQ513_05520 [Rhodospirillales bacterium]|nr:hypothetical protein [Rhodospirillales bacterium]